MLIKFSNKNNNFSKYRLHTVLFYNHGDEQATHAAFKIRIMLHMS